jgi:hypothetical protein
VNALVLTSYFDPTQIMADAAEALGGVLSSVAPVAVGLGIGVLGLFFGWHLLRSFIH